MRRGMIISCRHGLLCRTDAQNGIWRFLETVIELFIIDPKRCVLNERTSDVISEYVNSSIAVCSSRFEGFGMVIAEAMVCGIPVVSFDCPWGPRAIISDGEDGMLVENGNVEKLAEALVLMIQHPEQRNLMANKAIENVQRFRIDKISEKWRLLFDALYE